MAFCLPTGAYGLRSIPPHCPKKRELLVCLHPQSQWLNGLKSRVHAHQQLILKERPSPAKGMGAHAWLYRSTCSLPWLIRSCTSLAWSLVSRLWPSSTIFWLAPSVARWPEVEMFNTVVALPFTVSVEAPR